MVITLELHSLGGRGLLPDTEKQKPESPAVFTSGAQCSQQPLDDGKGCWWQLTFPPAGGEEFLVLGCSVSLA